MHRWLALVPMLLITLLLAPLTAAQEATPAASLDSGCAAPTEAEAETIANEYFDAFNTGDLDALDALLAPDYIHRGALGPDQDRELHKERVQIPRAGFPDAVYTIEDVIVDGDLVVIRHVMNGTNDGPYAGQALTGITVEVTGIHIHRIECGLIAETWNEGDGLGLYQRLGLVSAPLAATPVSTESSPVPQSTPAILAGECLDGTAAENIAVAEQWLDVWNTKDVTLYEELVHPKTVHHFGQAPDAVGIEALQAGSAEFFTAFPDLELIPEQVIADGDQVAIRFTNTGTHTGPFFGIEPTGVEWTYTGINIFRIECGQVVESWSEVDGLGLRRQLGVLEDPTGATPPS